MLLRLPPELCLVVFELAGGAATVMCARTCRRLRELVASNSEQLFEAACRREFGDCMRPRAPDMTWIEAYGQRVVHALDPAGTPLNNTCLVLAGGEAPEVALVNAATGESEELWVCMLDDERVQQPTWALGAHRLAFVTFRPGLGMGFGDIKILENAHRDDFRSTSVTISSPPFYLLFSPDGTELFYLARWHGVDGRLALHRVDIAVGSDDRSLRATEPEDVLHADTCFFDLNPCTQALLINSSLGLDGTLSLRPRGTTGPGEPIASVDARPGLAPIWLSRRGALVVTEEDQQWALTLLRFDNRDRFDHAVVLARSSDFADDSQPDSVRLIPSPDRRRIAMFRVEHPQRFSLWVFELGDVDGDEPWAQRTRVSIDAEQPLSGVWAPDSSALHILFVKPTGPPVCFWATAAMDDAGPALAARQVSRNFQVGNEYFSAYLPFADQYERNLSPISADGRWLAYATSTVEEPSASVEIIDLHAAADVADPTETPPAHTVPFGMVATFPRTGRVRQF